MKKVVCLGTKRAYLDFIDSLIAQNDVFERTRASQFSIGGVKYIHIFSAKDLLGLRDYTVKYLYGAHQYSDIDRIEEIIAINQDRT